MRAYVLVSFDTSDTHLDDKGYLVALEDVVDTLKTELSQRVPEHRPCVTVTVNPDHVLALDRMTDEKRDPKTPWH